jgi:hypothetical protein
MSTLIVRGCMKLLVHGLHAAQEPTAAKIASLPRAGVVGALAVAATGAASLLKPAAASAAASSSAPNVLATVAEAAAIVPGDTAWVLTSTALVSTPPQGRTAASTSTPQCCNAIPWTPVSCC